MRYVWHIVKYILVFILNLLILLFVHSYFNFIVMIVMIVFPFISAGVAFFASKALTVSFGGAGQDIVTDKPFLVSVILDNASIFSFMNVDIELTFTNALFDIQGTHNLCIPAYQRSSDVVDYQLTQSFAGVLNVRAASLCVTDWLGFFRIRRKTGAEKDYIVYPESIFPAQPDMMVASGGMTEAEESTKKGYDFSEVTDVREYIPGDKLQNIHWKLSAKKDILMVKERESMSSEKLVVFVDLVNDETNVLNDIIKAAYGFLEYLISENIAFDVDYWSTAMADVIHSQPANEGELREWVEKIFYEKVLSTPEYGISMYRKLQDDDKKFMIITKDDGTGKDEVFSFGHNVKGYIVG